MADEEHQGLPAARPRHVCDGKRLKEAFQAAAAWIEVHTEEINSLNVFPVPDGDTGTNMLLTCRAALDEMAKAGDTVPEVMHAASHGSLMGARGNSGVILSQILRGMARSFDNKPTVTAADVADGLREGAVTAYKGVMKPVEGTILTVIRETAEATVVAARETGNLVELLNAAVSAARTSVARTPSLLLPLRQAGVVDAGGQGLYVLLEGVQRYVRGETAEGVVLRRADLEQLEVPAEGYGYDVQFLLHGENLNVEAIRAQISALTESTLVVGDEKTVKVHAHAVNPGPVLAYAAGQGSLSRVIVENMQDQYRQFRAGGQAESQATQKPAATVSKNDQGSFIPPHELLAAQSAQATQLTGISTVVVATGAGLERIFKSLEATAVVPGGQTMNPSTQDILSAIESAPTDEVIVLPNNKNIIMAAEEARRLSKKSVAIVPSKTIPQGIAAILALNYEADLETNRAAMERAAASVRTGEITRAVRSTHIDELHVRKGQIIGLSDDRLVAAADGIDDVVLATLAEMQAEGAELLTLYYGDSIEAVEASALAERVRAAYPAAQVDVVEGGQPHYMYIMSAE